MWTLALILTAIMFSPLKKNLQTAAHSVKRSIKFTYVYEIELSMPDKTSQLIAEFLESHK